jgi:hypothetical protein
VSVFTPYGVYPNGYWREKTGVISIDLGVKIIDGGWFWQQKSIWFKSFSLPLWLFPSSHAYKRVIEGRYEFSVSFELPFIGKLLSYSGLLDISPDGK